MTKGKLKKIVRGVLIIIGAFVIIGVIANWYVSNRLNNYLNDKLSESISDATNGFYNFSFDEFSVGFFNGELSIQGIQLEPDSAVFAEWAAIDSLPKTFFKIDIGSIDFKGLNLKWRVSYSDLHFDVFEIQSPHIEIFDIYNSKQYSYKTKKFNPKDLYETVSPYLNTVTVKQINLENAYVSYSVEDSIAKTIYKLEDFDFHALGFRLDENSATSGKLLYSDNFNFIASTPQTLLSNSQLELKTSNIELNTQDSVVQIDNIRIVPRVLKEEDATEDYVKAEIKTVAVRGIAFERKDAQTYLTSRTFDILSTDVEYCSIVQEKPEENHASKQEKIAQADSLIQNWSLYGMISPLLHSATIDRIKFADAKVQYSVKSKDHTDIYNLDKFDFIANNFKVDSATTIVNRFNYSDNFALNATGIKGYMPSKNHELSIGGMFLNTDTKQFEIEDIKIKPISTKTRSDYLFGTVTAIKVKGLEYNTGIDADQLEISNPRIDYTMTGQSDNSTSNKSSEGLSQSDVANLLNPILKYLSVKRIDLNDAYVRLNDKIENSRYELNNFKFHASDFLIDENTRLTKKYLFTCQNLELRFQNFDNILPGKDYRLIIKNGLISAIPGRIYLKDVNLIPLAAKASISLNTNLIDISEINHNFNEKNNNQELRIGKINIPNIDAKYWDQSKNDSIKLSFTNLTSNGLSWSANKKITAANFALNKIILDITDNSQQTNLQVEKINLSNIDWGLSNNTYTNIGKISIQNPLLAYRKSTNEKGATDTINTPNKERDFYDSLSSFRKNIHIGTFDLSNANGDFIYTVNKDTLKEQMANNINLSFEKLAINTDKKSVTFENLDFEAKNLQYPIADGFYTVKANDVKISQKDSLILISKLHLDPQYPKMEFAYKHPKHKDWFDVSSDNITLSGIDFPRYFKDNTLKVKNVKLTNTDLRNFKNQQIEIEHNIMPLIYEGLQKAPMKLDIENIDIDNFSVFYEELAKKGTYPGKIYFKNMNGRISGVTNIASRPNQYIWLSANGIFLDNAPFEATWMIPVSPENDKFYLDGHIYNFDLKELNQIIVPLASAEVKSGTAKDVQFKIEASSKEATIDMSFLYNDLKVTIYKDVEEDKSNKFISGLANLVIRDNNPRKEGGKPHISNGLKVTRDPYHSTFNYFWQILKPATVEAVGVSKTTQDVATGISGFFKKVKNFFTGKKDNKNEEK